MALKQNGHPGHKMAICISSWCMFHEFFHASLKVFDFSSNFIEFYWFFNDFLCFCIEIPWFFIIFYRFSLNFHWNSLIFFISFHLLFIKIHWFSMIFYDSFRGQTACQTGPCPTGPKIRKIRPARIGLFQIQILLKTDHGTAPRLPRLFLSSREGGRVASIFINF